ncbi:hypothetical protein IQ07DRAFT_592360 [Pyrenochaeta sp. DS3sAY3a]|nr:hypothetical protein IQ07DRAFT_592360 [Pyrenochaeta sp. DS3sAY3a]
MMSHRCSQTPIKRELSPLAGDPALSPPNLSSSSFKRSQAPTPPALPPVGLYRTTLPTPMTHKSTSKTSLQKKSSSSPSRLVPSHFLPSTAPALMTTTSASESQVESMATDYSLSIAELVDVFSGTSKQPSITSAIAAIQSSVEQLAKVCAQSIDAADGERMINVLQASQDGDDELLGALKTSLWKPNATPFTSHDMNEPRTDFQTTLKINSARDEGYEAGLAAAKVLYEREIDKRQRESYQNGFKCGIELARKVQTAHKVADGGVKQK